MYIFIVINVNIHYVKLVVMLEFVCKNKNSNNNKYICKKETQNLQTKKRVQFYLPIIIFFAALVAQFFWHFVFVCASLRLSIVWCFWWKLVIKNWLICCPYVWLLLFKISENLAHTGFCRRTGFNMVSPRYSFAFFWIPLTISSNYINNTIFQFLPSLLRHVPVGFTIRIPYHSLAFML